MKAASLFTKGSGVYECGCCGRKTRSTGRGDNENCELCEACFDLAGFENAWQDGNHAERDTPECERLYAEIIAKGGDASEFFGFMSSILAAKSASGIRELARAAGLVAQVCTTGQEHLRVDLISPMGQLQVGAMFNSDVKPAAAMIVLGKLLEGVKEANRD